MITVTVQDHPVGPVTDTVQGGRRLRVGWGKPPPLGEVEIAGDDDGPPFIAIGDQVMEVLILGGPNRFKTKVVNDQKIGLGQGLETPIEGVGGPGGLEQPQQFTLGGKQDVVTLTDSAVAEGLSDMTFTDTGGTGDQHRDLFLDITAGGQVQDQGPNRGRKRGRSF